MSKLLGRKINSAKKLSLDGGVEIEIYPLPFGAVINIQKEYEEARANGTELEYMKEVILKYTNLEEPDLSESADALSIEEATLIFGKLIAGDPKVDGQKMTSES